MYGVCVALVISILNCQADTSRPYMERSLTRLFLLLPILSQLRLFFISILQFIDIQCKLQFTIDRTGNKVLSVFHRELTIVDPRTKVIPGRLLFREVSPIRTWCGFVMMDLNNCGGRQSRPILQMLESSAADSLRASALQSASPAGLSLKRR